MPDPWTNWIPGVLNKRQIKELCDGEYLITNGPVRKGALDNSSLDLSLADEGYKMVEGSVKPSTGEAYNRVLQKKRLVARVQKNDEGTYILKARHTYVFKLRESLGKDLAREGFYGQATAKSSVGRVDVLARLIVDGMNTYECFDTNQMRGTQYPKKMYLEITPMTFDVQVKEGVSLSQLRIFYGDPKSVEVESRELFRTILGDDAKDGSLSVDLSNEKIGGLPVAAFCARDDTEYPIPLWKKRNKLSPWQYWKFVPIGRTRRLQVKKGLFYILRSKEKISVPRGIAVYCRASDETIGEMRIHYAGFVHPLFGQKRSDDQRGTPLIFELRGHQVDVSLAHNEKMANLIFYRMSEDCQEKGKASSYQNQALQLSKPFFMDWPEKLRKINEDGIVEPA